MKQIIKHISYDVETRHKLKSGVDKLANAVKSTLGASGKNVIIQREMQLPLITKDGVTVAKHIILKDPIENMGADLIKSVAEKTADNAGDGCQPLWSKISTPNGWTTMAEIKKGDLINGTNNTVQTVEEVYEKGNLQIHQVKFADGRVVDCDDTHIWTVITNYGAKKSMSTRALIDSGRITMKNNRHGYYVQSEGVNFPQKSVPIDPYTLGVLLGDGSLSGETIELSLGFKKQHIIDKLILPEGVRKDVTHVEKSNSFRVKLYGKSLSEILEQLNLRGVNSFTKFIPDEYLYNDYTTRENLLQGLLDMGGYKNKRGRFVFSTVSGRLARNFEVLCYSLGISLNFKFHTRDSDDNSYSYNPIHRFIQLKGYKYGNKIVSITPTDVYTPMRCIKVSNNDKLYFTDNFILTHNTTTATVLTQAILHKAFELIKSSNQSMNLIQLKRELDLLTVDVVEKLESMKKNIDSEEHLRQVATISANGDTILGSIIAKAISKVGVGGYVSVEDSENDETYLSHVEGMQIDRGYFSSYFVTDMKKMVAELNNTFVMVYAGTLSTAKELLPVLEGVVSSGKPLVIIAEDFEAEVAGVLAQNKLSGVIKVCLIKAASFGDNRKEIMKDIAVSTGATFITPELGHSIKNISMDYLGQAERIISKKENSVIIGGIPKVKEYNDRKELLESLINDSKLSMFERNAINERYANFTNGVSIIKVGANSEVELQEKKDRIEDALFATKSATEYGIVAGGGIPLLKISTEYSPSKYINKSIEKNLAYDILFYSLKKPFETILENAGYSKNDIREFVKRFTEDSNVNMGLDVRNNTNGDMFEMGIIDPFKITKSALLNAVSIAGLILTTDASISIEEIIGEDIETE